MSLFRNPRSRDSVRGEPYIRLATLRFRVAQHRFTPASPPKRQKHICGLMGRPSGVTFVQLIQKLFGRDEIGGLEALGEAVVYRL